MKINADQLSSVITKSTPTIIILTGDEPLLMQEAFDAVLAQAKKWDFNDRETMTVGTSFDWSSFSYESNAPSLFCNKRIIDVRLSSLKIGDKGSQAFCAYASNPPPDTLLLISTPKLDANTQKSKWLSAIEKAGLLVTIWPIDRTRLPGWIATRLKAARLPHSPKLANTIAARTEGNLLAANQHIQKLALLQQDTPMDEKTMASAITAANHYTVFDLVSSTLTGDAARAIRIIRSLKAEKTEITLALWAICAELRVAAYLLHHEGQKPFAELCRNKGVWQKRQDDLSCFIKRQHSETIIRKYISLAAHIDTLIKGAGMGDAWDTLENLVISMSLPKKALFNVYL